MRLKVKQASKYEQPVLVSIEKIGPKNFLNRVAERMGLGRERLIRHHANTLYLKESGVSSR